MQRPLSIADALEGHVIFSSFKATTVPVHNPSPAMTWSPQGVHCHVNSPLDSVARPIITLANLFFRAALGVMCSWEVHRGG